ncbi:MAG: hypothetical protein HY392_04585 [Candidatus Diapherotrites archaeon]|nr:hypothetical protein [Candidatus Diapherotrites archaeon]
MQTETIGKEKLLDFLVQVDKVLPRKIRANCVGGTGLTLLNAKNVTKDIDFDFSHEDEKEFKKALNRLPPHGLRIDFFTDGFIFSQKLPNDYEAHCVPIKTMLKNIELFSLSPVDIIVTKIGRLNDRDIEDIKACIKKFRINKKQVETRGKQIEYVGHEETYTTNLGFVLKNFFK